MLDLKGTNRRLAGAVRTVMDGAGDGRPYTVCSRNWALLDEFQQRANVRVVHSVGSAGQLRALRQRLAHRQVGAISIHRRLLTPELVQSLREHGVLIMTWPVNTPALLDRLAAWGVHGAIIDDLTVLRGVTARPMAAPRVP
jgi:glycerophosphoryl diester phosphodiesterase